MVYKFYIVILCRQKLKEVIEMNLQGRHFLTLKDYSPEEIEYLLNLSAELKAKK